jgi:hypothetical protein
MSANLRFWWTSTGSLLLACALSCLLVVAAGAQETRRPGGLVEHLQGHLGLSEQQAKGALGALLAFAEQRLHPSDFNELTASIPNAQHILRAVSVQGVIAKPLDSVAEFEAALSKVGIAQPLASQVAPTVIDYLGMQGYQRERDLLARVTR